MDQGCPLSPGQSCLSLLLDPAPLLFACKFARESQGTVFLEQCKLPILPWRMRTSISWNPRTFYPSRCIVLSEKVQLLGNVAAGEAIHLLFHETCMIAMQFQDEVKVIGKAEIRSRCSVAVARCLAMIGRGWSASQITASNHRCWKTTILQRMNAHISLERQSSGRQLARPRMSISRPMWPGSRY